MHLKNTILAFLMTVVSLVLGVDSHVFADETGVIEVGGECNDEGLTYNLTSDIIKSLWELNKLYAVPPGIGDPGSWSDASSFNIQFESELESGDPAGYASACAEIWQDFFDEDADVIFNVRRTITATHQILQCLSGTWVSTSSQPLEINDISDWLKVDGSPYSVANPSSQTNLQNDLQILLDTLNAQPGASSEPSE